MEILKKTGKFLLGVVIGVAIMMLPIGIMSKENG